MNPVDNNINVRQTRSETEQVNRRESDVERAGTGAAPADGAAGESVSFTRTAADLLSLETELRELPGVDRERVESFRQAISDGSYQIDTSRIVDSLLRSDREVG